ncbi:apolipoprotein C-I [Polypterus senegalus]|uniref:apolipoprotein C-I n=1 Tax=Polypterus senegalus TaxID=55291 RepID=UPI0019628369|nr:apolipoprotein C-I [Polypterus senegalus]
MRILLIAALVLVAVIALAEAEEKPILAQHFETIQTHMEDLGQKAREAFEKVQNSEFTSKTRNWFTEQFEKMKQSWSELVN